MDEFADVFKKHPTPWDCDSIGTIMDANGTEIADLRPDEEGAIESELAELIVTAVNMARRK
jgi:hypothetical protein